MLDCEGANNDEYFNAQSSFLDGMNLKEFDEVVNYRHALNKQFHCFDALLGDKKSDINQVSHAIIDFSNSKTAPNKPD